MFFAALFWVYGDYKPQNRKSNSKQKTSPQSYKTQINILPFPGLAQTGTEQLGQGATLLGWPKSIYYIITVSPWTNLKLQNQIKQTSSRFCLGDSLTGVIEFIVP